MISAAFKLFASEGEGGRPEGSAPGASPAPRNPRRGWHPAPRRATGARRPRGPPCRRVLCVRVPRPRSPPPRPGALISPVEPLSVSSRLRRAVPAQGGIPEVWHGGSRSCLPPPPPPTPSRFGCQTDKRAASGGRACVCPEGGGGCFSRD